MHSIIQMQDTNNTGKHSQIKLINLRHYMSFEYSIHSLTTSI